MECNRDLKAEDFVYVEGRDIYKFTAPRELVYMRYAEPMSSDDHRDWDNRTSDDFRDPHAGEMTVIEEGADCSFQDDVVPTPLPNELRQEVEERANFKRFQNEFGYIKFKKAQKVYIIKDDPYRLRPEIPQKYDGPKSSYGRYLVQIAPWIGDSPCPIVSVNINSLSFVKRTLEELIAKRINEWIVWSEREPSIIGPRGPNVSLLVYNTTLARGDVTRERNMVTKFAGMKAKAEANTKAAVEKAAAETDNQEAVLAAEKEKKSLTIIAAVAEVFEQRAVAAEARLARVAEAAAAEEARLAKIDPLGSNVSVKTVEPEQKEGGVTKLLGGYRKKKRTTRSKKSKKRRSTRK